MPFMPQSAFRDARTATGVEPTWEDHDRWDALRVAKLPPEREEDPNRYCGRRAFNLRDHLMGWARATIRVIG